MAKNFTQFQSITGNKTTDGQTGDVTRTTQANKGMYVVGYSANEPGGEKRFTIESLLYTAEPSDLGLEHVTNESKATMFTDATFTGSTTADGDLRVTQDLYVQGQQVINDTLTTTASAGVFTNLNQTNALVATQQDTSSTYDIAKFMSDTEPAMIIDSGGTVSIGIDTTIANQNNHKLHVLGNTYSTHVSAESFNGQDIVAMDTKLDTIMAFADSTVMVLSSVEATMQAIANDQNNTLNVGAAQKGFDLLEDGDNFKKLPALSASNTSPQAIAWSGNNSMHPGLTIGNVGYGTWDASEQKLYSIEHGADVTGAHSADIIFADVPDTPPGGLPEQTYVKMTSANKVYWDSIRGVTNKVHTADQGNPLQQQDIVAAYQEGFTDYWSSNDELEYRDTIIPTLTGCVQNKRDNLSVPNQTAVGDAELNNLESTNITCDQITANTDVYVVSGGQAIAGVNYVLDIDDNEYHFVNGILVRVVT